MLPDTRFGFSAVRGISATIFDHHPVAGGSDRSGSWDVIHVNHGVRDATYREATSKSFSGHNTTAVADFEKNLRILVGKMKQTGSGR